LRANTVTVHHKIYPKTSHKNAFHRIGHATAADVHYILFIGSHTVAHNRRES
jgi:hypothetical protein